MSRESAQIDMKRAPYRGIYKEIGDELGVDKSVVRRGVKTGSRKYTRIFNAKIEDARRQQEEAAALVGREVQRAA